VKAKPTKPAEEIPEPTLIGYFARPTSARPAGFEPNHVEWIASVADCVGHQTGFDEHFDWQDNGMSLYDTPELAWSIVPEALRSQCDLYAYWTFPVHFVLGRQVPFKLKCVNPVPMDDTFSRLGYDLVSREHGCQFNHSPLSCNGLAEQVTVNRYCLLDTAEEAFALAPTLEVPGQPMRGEPGPYHIVEVWRQRVSASTS
jgi:hypothetical protein